MAVASGKRPVAKYHLVVMNPQDTVSEIIEFIAVHDHKYCLFAFERFDVSGGAVSRRLGLTAVHRETASARLCQTGASGQAFAAVRS